MMQLTEGASAWMRREIRPEEYRVDLSAACLDEIRRAADEIRAYPLPTILRAPDDFAMPACRAANGRVRDILDHGRRFAIVDRLPIADIERRKRPQFIGCCRAWYRARWRRSSTAR